MSRFPPITLARLGRMEVLETIDSDAIIAARMERLVYLWGRRDPPAAALYDVQNLEFDPTKINQEVGADFEMLVRDRVNQATRATTLAYATGNDLEAIASRYPQGVPRLPIVVSPRSYETNPEDWEDDDHYRERIWLSGDAFSTAGAEAAYEFWARTAEPTLHDATAVVVRPSSYVTPTIVVTALANDGAPPVATVSTPMERVWTYTREPRPTRAQIIAVHRKLHERGIRPATDVVQVAEPIVLHSPIRVGLWLYPAATPAAVLDLVQEAFFTLVEKKRRLGEDLTRMTIDGACDQPDVQDAVILEPAATIPASPRQFIAVDSISIKVMGFRE